jgi:hypothetical protein
MLERLTHISFATWQMSNAAEALVASAYAHGVENVWVYASMRASPSSNHIHSALPRSEI